MAALVGTEYLSGQTASGSAVSAIGPQTQDVALLAGAVPAFAPISVTSGSGTTLSATALLDGIITRSGPSSPFSDATDTAANILGALPATTPNSFVRLVFIQNTTAFLQTITAGSGVTLAGDIVVPAKGTWIGLIQKTSSSLVRITGLLAVYDAGGFGTNGGPMPNTLSELFGGSASGITFTPGFFAPQISSAGVQPGATGADNVLAVFSLPASALDGVRNRGLKFTARGSFASNGNTKELKIIANPSTAVVGSTVGSGGTTICDTGAVTTNGGGWAISASFFKYGAAGSNTQLGWSDGVSSGTNIAPATVTATESGIILFAVTGNATSATTDITFNAMLVEGVN